MSARTSVPAGALGCGFGDATLGDNADRSRLHKMTEDLKAERVAGGQLQQNRGELQSLVDATHHQVTIQVIGLNYERPSRFGLFGPGKQTQPCWSRHPQRRCNPTEPLRTRSSSTSPRNPVSLHSYIRTSTKDGLQRSYV